MQLFLSSSPFQEDCLLFFTLFYYSLLFLKFERGGLQPPYPPSPLDPTHTYCRAFGSGSVTIYFYDLGLSRLGFELGFYH